MLRNSDRRRAQKSRQTLRLCQSLPVQGGPSSKRGSVDLPSKHRLCVVQEDWITRRASGCIGSLNSTSRTQVFARLDDLLSNRECQSSTGCWLLERYPRSTGELRFQSRERIRSRLELDRLSHRVTRAGVEIDLQPREFRFLEYLMRHAGQVVTRTMLLEHVWDYHFDPQTNVIDVHVSRLRAKIDKGHVTPLIHTVRGAGYTIREQSR